MIAEDREHVERVLAGDANAFDGLVRKYNRLGGAIAFGVLGDFDLAEDVVQEAFFRAYSSLENLRKPERFRLWFAGIVKKRAIDVLRQIRSREKRNTGLGKELPDLPSEGESPEDHLLREERRRKVLEAMSELSPEDRLVVALKHMEGLSYKEISDITHTSVSAVESRLFRARKALKGKLTEAIRSDL